MNIHEYQAKALLKGFGMPVPDGRVVRSPDEALLAARAMGAPLVVVKAQIHAGGRGAGHFAHDPGGKGGVRLARTPEDAEQAAIAMLDQTLVTRQTGSAGRVVRRLYIEAGCDIGRELYLSLLVDRGTGRIVIVASQDGGMAIEDVAAATPERILKEPIDPATGLSDYQARTLAARLDLHGRSIRAFTTVLRAAYDAFVALDAAIVEINPLVVTRSGDLLALDAKMSFDDNALFRHPELEELRDENEEDPREREAARHGLAYVGLDGTIGCMVNGAGLAMATMDIIKMEGEEPANFLDVGGGATRERVAAAFRILLSDRKVRGILVNIFGGIMRCDIIADAIVAASRETGLHVPLVVRLAGTNVEQGHQILSASGLRIIPADDLADAATKIVAAVRETAFAGGAA
ncbi:succinyl-CoA synthetase, beta subunit [Gluconacetobacter diazotrophicus PA1 5]|uniref:Succinate--CoA ligase [ADP-forming] subunit beta n=2 Tax=Gluconacetobacter diazotrophicus TaxID=33996 RepID=A9HRF0_GLUDA|nr:ADP-forming succinate--CoA ligase subunit beta [Gluconacetobacter diazotrophicus]ACI53124.1 succinyl-CoA synthetase, beta subunit [Gluconacetobacter diazotrophicus PA1 5]MBB2155965.1 ADP-forming succinate--CoA ligase subunit beta [Gluconacetobacter diazotrophicus]TWB05600.1 succinyl-CoA synthetase beta subunit [Gluconacetobacter diazotrophicus]CAP56894.1 putative succinyl-CoA synthetase beta chain [Gluconacetobacter diazotrophicus PA1 5]